MQSRRWMPQSRGDLTIALQAQRAGKRSVVFLILGCLAALGWSYVILFSEFFTVTDVQAEGLKTLDQVEITREVYAALDERGDERGLRLWSNRNIFFLDEERLKQSLTNRLFIAEVTVDKIGRNILRLKIEERSKRLILHSRQQYAWIDLQGVVTDELTADERKHVQARLLGQRLALPDEPPIIKRNLDETVSVGFSVFKGEESRDWIKMSDQLMAAGLAYREFEPPDDVSTKIRILAPEGFNVIMDTLVPLESQIKTYLTFIKTKAKELEPSKVEYIDVTVPGRVYIK